jgi:hypothetical protein
MSQSVKVEYECGMVISQYAALKPDQTLLANAPLGDTLIAQADQIHDTSCKVCK